MKKIVMLLVSIMLIFSSCLTIMAEEEPNNNVESTSNNQQDNDIDDKENVVGENLDSKDKQDGYSNNSIQENDLAVVKNTVLTLQSGTDFNKNISSDTTAIEFVSYREVPSNVTTIDVSSNKDGSIIAWNEGTTMYVSPSEEGNIIYANSSCYSMFNTLGIRLGSGTNAKIETIKFENFNTSNVTDMTMMFGGCPNLKSLDLESFNTSNVTNMTSMFYGCSNLSSLDLSVFDTSKVTTMLEMFM